jgi:hypothetical protein
MTSKKDNSLLNFSNKQSQCNSFFIDIGGLVFLSRMLSTPMNYLALLQDLIIQAISSPQLLKSLNINLINVIKLLT